MTDTLDHVDKLLKAISLRYGKGSDYYYLSGLRDRYAQILHDIDQTKRKVEELLEYEAALLLIYAEEDRRFGEGKEEEES